MTIDKKYALDKAVVVLFNPALHMRAILRSAMTTLGFQHVLDYGDLQQARNAVIERGPDLVLLDLDADRAAVCRLVREVRNSNLCADPFVPIIAFTWSPDLAMINTSMEAGVDDIIAMPISLKLIYDRIDILIRARKDFVVTSSYVGPDRRSSERGMEDELGLGTIKVPNNLRFKATGDREAMASSDAVSEVKARIDHHRLNRYAQRIQWLIGEILKSKGDGSEIAKITIQRHDEIGRLIEDMAFDLRTQGHVELLEITDSMTRLLDMVRASHRPQFYEFLRLHAMAIIATLLERDGAANMVKQALKETADYLDRVRAA